MSKIGWGEFTIEQIKADYPSAIAMGPFGSNIKTDNFVESGVPIIRGNNLTNGFNDKDFVYLTEEKADKLKSSNAFPNDIIFTHRGTLGQVGIIPQDARFPRYVVSQSQMKLACNIDLAYPLFVYYFFKSPIGQQKLLANSNQTGVPAIAQPLTSLKQIKISLPPLPEQKLIAHILGALDDKIQINRQMNITLEATARAIFQSWFVSFDPVHAKARGEMPYGMDAETADLFPDDFVESELGMIPRGWRVGTLNDITEFVIGGDWGTSEISDINTFASYCIRGADIPSLQSGGIGKMPVRYLKTSSAEKRRLQSGDIVIEISGGSPTQQTGRSVLITNALLSRLDLPIVFSNFCRVMRIKKSIPAQYIYLWMDSLYNADLFFQYESGTTGIKNFAFTEFSSEYPLLIPTEKILSHFEKKLVVIFEKIQANGVENDILTEIRDSLLPKLISGEIQLEGLT